MIHASRLPDNDEVGRKHGEQVAASVARYASGVKVVHLPGLQEHGDVSDFLQAHSVEDIFAEIKGAELETGNRARAEIVR